MAKLVWFRNDLRLRDNPALSAAAKTGDEILPVYILDPNSDWPVCGASGVWLHHSLTTLASEIEEKGGTLLVLSGKPIEVLQKLVKKYSVDQVFWNRNYDVQSVNESTDIKLRFRDQGIESHSFGGNLLKEPWEIKNGKGEPYKVFTPYWRAVQKELKTISSPLSLPRQMKFVSISSNTKIEALELLSGRPWESQMMSYWNVGEQGAKHTLQKTNDSFLKGYDRSRDIPSIDGTSCLSPHLHFGEISPRQVLDFVKNRKLSESFVRQIVWREFAHSLLYYFPKTPTEPLNPQFEKFKWQKNKKHLRKWQKGQTGYPIVDAGMRQLWETGWMHNRVRMVVASFLIKHLLIHWVEGAKWFWDTLVDANLANNTMGWQWVAGCGADASPFFRIFNPMTQGKKFDPDGNYIRKWVPELRDVPTKYIHEPWTASLNLNSYPDRIVIHEEARNKALEEYKRTKS